jgi:hypothetical protein
MTVSIEHKIARRDPTTGLLELGDEDLDQVSGGQSTPASRREGRQDIAGGALALSVGALLISTGNPIGGAILVAVGGVEIGEGVRDITRG